MIDDNLTLTLTILFNKMLVIISKAIVINNYDLLENINHVSA